VVVRVEQIKVMSSKTLDQMEMLFRERAAQLRSRVAEKIADSIVDNSPVDTGTYILAHVAGVGESDAEATRSSQGKQRGRNRAQFVGLAKGNLKRSVSASAVAAGNEIWFRNRALHAARVEYLGWAAPLFGRSGTGSTKQPYHVYAKARAYAPVAVREAAVELGFTTR
jgi:hypothetical protein